MTEISTRLTKTLGCRYPIMNAGMSGIATSELAAAVSNAGGYGCMGVTGLSDKAIKKELENIRRLTDKPFACNHLATKGIPNFEHRIDIMLDGGMKVFITGLGVDKQIIEKCHARGCLVGAVVAHPRHVTKALESSVDIIIVQGSEGGGHTGRIATIALVPIVLDMVKGRLPVVAAGGIMDGRGLAAALAMGADGVWMGTRFVASHESRVAPGFKDALVKADCDSTTISRGYTSKTCRVLKNQYTNYWETKEEPSRQFVVQVSRSIKDGANHLGDGPAARGVKDELEFRPAGQGVGMIQQVLPAAKIVQEMADTAVEYLSRASATVVRSKL